MPREPVIRRRVLILGKRGRTRTEASLARGARALGHQARLLDVPGWRRRLGPLSGIALRRMADIFAPDTVLLTRYAADLDDRTLLALTRGRRSLFWFFDLVEAPHPRIVRLGRVADLMAVTCPGQIQAYRAAGVDIVGFLPQAADPVVDRPADRAERRYQCEVSFVGSGGYPYRHALLRRIAATYALQIRGPGWAGVPGLMPADGPVRGASFRQVVRGADVSFGANAIESQAREPLCASNRMWKIMAAGGFYLGPRVPGIEQLARDDEHCAWYGSDDDALDQISHYLGRPDDRARIARAGRTHTLTDHTYARRLELLLEGRTWPL